MGYTDLLYAQPSFLEGLSRVIDPAGILNQYNISASAEEADMMAMWSDWAAVGADLIAAKTDFDKHTQQKSASVQTK